jgi:hypothetical protein
LVVDPLNLPGWEVLAVTEAAHDYPITARYLPEQYRVAWIAMHRPYRDAGVDLSTLADLLQVDQLSGCFNTRSRIAEISDKNGRYGAASLRSVVENSESIRIQRRGIEEVAAELGFIIPDEYWFVDNGVAGASEDRRAWRHLIEVAPSESPGFIKLFATDPSRLGHWAGPRKQVHYHARLEKHGIAVFYCGALWILAVLPLRCSTRSRKRVFREQVQLLLSPVRD